LLKYLAGRLYEKCPSVEVARQRTEKLSHNKCVRRKMCHIPQLRKIELRILVERMWHGFKSHEGFCNKVWKYKTTSSGNNLILKNQNEKISPKPQFFCNTVIRLSGCKFFIFVNWSLPSACLLHACCLRWHTALGNQAAACNLILTVPFGGCSVGTAWVGGSGLLGSLLSVSSGWLAFPSLLLAFPLRPWSGVLVLRKSPLVSFSEVSRCYAFINFCRV
jgi:hypothetical protein